jgi:hypothetical protein
MNIEENAKKMLPHALTASIYFKEDVINTRSHQISDLSGTNESSQYLCRLYSFLKFLLTSRRPPRTLTIGPRNHHNAQAGRYFFCYTLSMTRVVYIHHLGNEHDLEQFLRDDFVVKKVFANDQGEMIYQGSPVPYTFFDHHADVVVTSLPVHLHKAFVTAMPHIPTVGLNGYHGIYAHGAHRNVWQSHAKHKGISIPHSMIHDPENPLSIHELRNKTFLPSVVHARGGEYGAHAVKTFPELQEHLSSLSDKAHIERQIKGNHVYVISIKDFRDHDIYTTPLLHKTDTGYKVCSHIKDEQKEEAIRFVKELHDELGLGPVAEFEFVISNSELYLINVEPNPKQTDNSALHAGLESVGSSMKDLWKNIVETAKKKRT